MVRAPVERDRINCGAPRKQRDRLRRPAIVAKTCRVELRIGVVVAAGGAESAGVIVGDIVTGVEDRSGTIPAGVAARQNVVLEAGEIGTENGAARTGAVAGESAVGDD